MLPDRVSNPGPLTYESGALPEHTTYLHVKENRKDIHIMPPTLTSSNYPCVEHVFIVPKMFEPLRFYCSSDIFLLPKQSKNSGSCKTSEWLVV